MKSWKLIAGNNWKIFFNLYVINIHRNTWESVKYNFPKVARLNKSSTTVTLNNSLIIHYEGEIQERVE